MRLTLLLLFLLPTHVLADPVPYALDRDRSLVGFAFDLGADEIKGNMPVDSANIVLDLDRLSGSRAEVVLDTRGAITEAGFATEAMLGQSVLHAAQFPTITFSSTRIAGSLSRGTVEGR